MLAGARRGDEAAFEELVRRHRGGLYTHCYRMLGSPYDAEDALRESLVAAWRGLPGFQGPVRAWLFQAATNACLRAAARRPRRMLSDEYGPAREDVHDLGRPVPGPVWVEPLPGRPQQDGPDPAAYLRRESVELAFVAALQRLPGTQRAALVLSDVLGFGTAEVAGMLEATPASVSDALRRARAGVEGRTPGPTQRSELSALGGGGRRALVAAFVSAWEHAEVPALLDLLTEDARITMPPLPAWFEGHTDVGRFLSERVFTTPWRLLPVTANGQPAFACYRQDGGRFPLCAVSVLNLRGGRISWIAGFTDPQVAHGFAVPPEFPTPTQ
ncbi:RNA polymerase subunit sigma-24 [Spongiactinospora rosea]|uniref:RNA polymerase subunit sigma-24 n=1 Tax=Spongiactinospora rosea TaxID=2248750 RepID=A0A366LZN9_9ACTN|nr:RNA polymerase subunit sigma-24 [Spongiactinospora rosea]